jgi:hypothetical protein
MRTRLVLLGAMAALAAAPAAFGLTLVKDGAPVSAIVVAKGATVSVNYSAQELQYHLEKMSGAKVPILTDDKVGQTAPEALVLIGPSKQTEALGVAIPELQPEGFMIKTVGNALVIIGKDKSKTGPADQFYTTAADQVGTYYGVIDFLQDQLDCQWLWPGPTGEYIPKRATVEIGDIDIQEAPVLKRRHMRQVFPERKDFGPAEDYFDMSVKPKLTFEEYQWYRRVRMGRSEDAPSGHAFTKWWGRYGQTHPEIFAMHPGGSRSPNGPADRIKMDVSNPALWAIQLQNPRGHEFPCVEDDGSSGFCTCENCKAWDVTVDKLPSKILNKLDQALVDELTPGPDGLPECLSTRYAKWYNEVARRAREIDPQGYISGYAYTRFRETPLGVKLEPNMIIGYVGLVGAPQSPAQRAIDQRDYLGWAQPGVRMFIRPNAPHYCENGMPFNTAREMGAAMKFAVEHGAYMADFDSMLGHWASWGPTYYVVARMMWDGDRLPVETLLDEWYTAFGPCERQVRSYYDFWEGYITSVWVRPGTTERFQELGKMWPRGSNRVGRLLIIAEHYPPEVMAEARGLLDQAFATAKKANAGDSVMEKLKNVEMSLTNSEMTAQATRLSLDALLHPETKPAKMEELKKLLPELLAYRRQIADRNALNVYWQMREELELGDVLHWKDMSMADLKRP